MRFFLILLFMIALMAFTVNNPLIGKWETKPSEYGDVTGVVFKASNEFESYRNNTPYISGIYTVKGKVVEITDNGCGFEAGTYEFIFFANSDSLRFKAIDDGCERRKNAIESTILGRVK